MICDHFHLDSNLDFCENTLINTSVIPLSILFFSLKAFLRLFSILSQPLISKRLILGVIVCQTLILLMSTLDVGKGCFPTLHRISKYTAHKLQAIINLSDYKFEFVFFFFHFVGAFCMSSEVYYRNIIGRNIIFC